MDSLFIHFLRRAVLVPLIAAALAVAVILFAGPKAVARSEASANRTAQSTSVNLTDYSTRSYDLFEQLQGGDFVGTIQCESIGLGEKAIVFGESENSAIVMNAQSSEPWNEGGVLLTGSNTSENFKTLHKAEIGDEFTVSFYDNDAYTYRLKKIVPCAEADELNKYIRKNSLTLCLSYNDFTDLGNAYHYQVFIAERV